MGRLRRREPYHFGIDLFQAYIEKDQYKKSKLHGLSDGSDFWKYDKNTTIYYNRDMANKKFGKYFEIRDEVTRARLGFIMFGREDEIGSVERKDRFEVTGQGLILRNIPYYLKLLDVCGYFITGFKRVDIALDIKINTDYAIREIFLPNVIHKTCLPYIIKGKYTGLDIGQRLASNTWKFIRVYNKILDTKTKEKEFLYDMEKMGPDLTRVELELRRDKCKHFHVEYLTNPEKLYDIFKYEVFDIHYQFFKFIHKEDTMKCLESYFIDVFRDEINGIIFKGVNLTKGLQKKKLQEKQDRLQKFGSDFRTAKDRQRTLSCMMTYYRKLRINGTSYIDIMDILRIIEEEIKEHNLQHNNI